MNQPDKKRKQETRDLEADFHIQLPNQETFSEWMDIELQKLEEQFDTFKTVNSLRRYFER